MSCDAIALSAALWLAATPGAPPVPQAAAVAAPTSVASEPLFADIVRRASALRGEAESLGKADLGGAVDSLPSFAGFRVRLSELAALDMKGHVLLAARGTDGDLKCILKGIAQDLPVKLKDLEGAATAADRRHALMEMSYLLRDNVEVITSPPSPPA